MLYDEDFVCLLLRPLYIEDPYREDDPQPELLQLRDDPDAHTSALLNECMSLRYCHKKIGRPEI